MPAVIEEFLKEEPENAFRDTEGIPGGHPRDTPQIDRTQAPSTVL